MFKAVQTTDVRSNTQFLRAEPHAKTESRTCPLAIRTAVHAGDFEGCLRDCGGRCRSSGATGDALNLCYQLCFYGCLGK